MYYLLATSLVTAQSTEVVEYKKVAIQFTIAKLTYLDSYSSIGGGYNSKSIPILLREHSNLMQIKP